MILLVADTKFELTLLFEVDFILHDILLVISAHIADTKIDMLSGMGDSSVRSVAFLLDVVLILLLFIDGDGASRDFYYSPCFYC